MNDYYNEPYYEPTEADEIFFEAREKLINSLKGTVKQYVESVKTENEELKCQLEEAKSKLKGISQRESALEREKNNLISTVRKERLSELLADFQVERFMATTKTVLGPKCEKCDNERYIHYKTPLGKDAKEKCDCSNDFVLIYIPRSMICTEFAIDGRDNRNLKMWYKIKSYSNEEYYDSYSTYFKKVYNGESYETLTDNDLFFNTLEECQGYCDWLNREIDLNKYVLNENVNESASAKKRGA